MYADLFLKQCTYTLMISHPKFRGERHKEMDNSEFTDIDCLLNTMYF